MTELVGSRVFWAALAVWGLFFPAVLLFDSQTIFPVITGMTFVGSVMVIHAYWPAMIQSVQKRRRDMDIIDYLTLGIMCTWTSIAARFGYLAFVGALNGDTPLAYTSPFLAFTQYVTFTGAMLHLSARKVLRGQVPTSSWPRVAFAVVLGLIVGVALLFII